MVESRYCNRQVEMNMGRLAPTVRPFVEEIFTSGAFAVNDLELVSPQSGRPSPDFGTEDCDRFKLVLPYAGFSVVWEVIFDGTNPSIPPDFIFDDESFLCDCELELIPSLTKWNASTRKSLLYVITDLLNLYCKHQYHGVERCVGRTIADWLDLHNVNHYKIEILNYNQKNSPYSTLSRQATSSLQHGSTSVLVVVPLTSEFLDSKNFQFSVNYIFKSHAGMLEEKIVCSPELEGWIQGYSESFNKKNRWCLNSKALSESIQSHNQEISDMLNKAVRLFKIRQNLQLSLYHQIMSREELSACVLEFDWNDFMFSSYLLQDNNLFTVDFTKYPRARLFAVLPDGHRKLIGEIARDRLMYPKGDFANMLLVLLKGLP